ncbi:MAG TPA: hypothetical protein VMN60_04455 [Longimicrobiales bacterium]|nr:hypothetical protein [Longimicrobiales bacterium]
MDSQLRARAEARLEQAAAALGLADPRPPYRERLRLLRESHPDAFQRAVEHFEGVVLHGMAEGDAVSVWLDYGRFLASLTATGGLSIIDPSGRAAAYQPPLHECALVLFIPEEGSEPVLIAALPQQPSDAQQATVDLLVHRKLKLEDAAAN